MLNLNELDTRDCDVSCVKIREKFNGARDIGCYSHLVLLNEEREGRGAHLSETVIHRQAVAVRVASKDTVSVEDFLNAAKAEDKFRQLAPSFNRPMYVVQVLDLAKPFEESVVDFSPV